ncbi:MAG: glutaredoxin family protein [Planctomycetota bacterium]|nr:glutaredoxin family protein [Planctomycetota bacterium]
MEKISFYTKSECPLCDTGFAKLEELTQRFSLEIEKIDIETDTHLFQLYRYRIPVAVFRGEELGWGRLSAGGIESRLEQILASPGPGDSSQGASEGI